MTEQGCHFSYFCRISQGFYQGLKCLKSFFSIFKALKSLNFGHFFGFEVLKGLKKKFE